MADCSNLLRKAREILESGRHEGVEKLVSDLYKRKDSVEFQSAYSVYKLCVWKFPNCFALKLLDVYRFSLNRDDRFRSIYLLAKARTFFKLSLVALHEMKPLLISCLEMQQTGEAEIKIFRRIVSYVAYNLVMQDNAGWDELGQCILSLLATPNPLKAFHVFLDLPSLSHGFILAFMDNLQEKAYEVLLSPEPDGRKDWSLALQSLVKMGIHLLHTDFRTQLISQILSNLVKAASEVVDKGMEEFLVQGLEDLGGFLSQDNYNDRQCFFVRDFLFNIREIGARVKYSVRKINSLFKGSHNPAIKVIQPPEKQELSHAWIDYFTSLSPLELLRIVAPTDFDERHRELAMRRLTSSLFEHSLGKVEIDSSVMRQIQPVLISWLKQQGIPDAFFTILGQVVNHVATVVFEWDDGRWDALRDYFVSESKRDFRRALYVFTCFTTLLEDEFVLPLLPQISTRIECLENNCIWPLTFTGAFCAIIHLIDGNDHPLYVKELAEKMIRSATELVERGMEVDHVRFAFTEMERIVKNQLRWYGTNEYKFVKGLLRSLYGIKGMQMETKLVLWKINMRLEKEVSKLFKQLIDCKFDWLNQPLLA